MTEQVPVPDSNIRTRILNAALDLFANEGFHAVSVPRIAEKAGVGVGSIYRVAPSKVALADIIFEHAIAILRESVFYPVDLDGMPGEEVFWTFWNRTAEWLRKRPESMRFMVLYRFVGPPDRKSGLRRMGALEDLVGYSIKQGWMREMSFDVAAGLISGPLVVLTLDHKLDNDTVMATGEAVWKSIKPD